MSNLSKTFGLLGTPTSTTSRQPQSLTRKQSRKLTIPLLALLSIGMVLLTLTESTGFAQTFTTADFEGTWNVRGLSVRGNSGAWGYGTFTFNETGRLTGSYTTSTGHSESPSGMFSIDEHGVIRALNFGGLTSTYHGVMSRNKGMVVSTGTGGDGSHQLQVLVKTGGTFTTGDLEGVWNCHGLISGDPPNERPGWFYQSITIDREGNATFSPVTDSEGTKGDRSYPDKFSITEDGLVTMPLAPVPFYGVMNQDKDMVVIVATMGPGDDPGVRGHNLIVGLKAGGTFTQSDLQGTWYWHGLASGDDTAWQGWFHTTTVVDSSGSFSIVPGSYLNSSGETDIAWSGTMSITSDGIITIPGKPDAHGRMSIDKDMIVMTMDDGGGGYDLIIIVKAGAPDIEEIKNAYAGIEVAVETEDIDTLMSYFSDDFLHDDQDKIHWWSQFQQLFDNYQNIQVEFTNVQIAVNGDAATATLHVKITGELQDGGAVETITDEDMSEDYLNYWLKEDRIWRLYGNQPLMIPMGSLDFSRGGNGLNIYLYDCVSRIINIVKQNTNDSWWPSLNTDYTMMVYTEGLGYSPYTINLYDIASKTSTTITTATTRYAAYFDKSGKILFIDSSTGILKKMDTNGTNIITVANPESPYSFSVFWISPDREKIVVGENRQEGSDYDTGNYERLVLMNSDGTDRTVIIEEYLGEWNLLSWKPDSSGFLYYHHLYNGLSGEDFKKFLKYLAFDLSSDTITINDLSDSDMGKEENICLYTKSGNLLSMTYRELYDGKTGTLIADRSSDVPLITEAMFGVDINGEIYFADLNGSNFRKFVEIPTDFNYE
ncbi:MAG: YybH family protein [Planctomycetota bacterium]